MLMCGALLGDIIGSHKFSAALQQVWQRRADSLMFREALINSATPS